jgi:hypothetical protein
LYATALTKLWVRPGSMLGVGTVVSVEPWGTCLWAFATSWLAASLLASSPGMFAVAQWVPLVKLALRPYFVASPMISSTSWVHSGDPYANFDASTFGSFSWANSMPEKPASAISFTDSLIVSSVW